MTNALIGFGVDKLENDTFVTTPMELKHIKNLYRYLSTLERGVQYIFSINSENHTHKKLK